MGDWRRRRGGAGPQSSGWGPQTVRSQGRANGTHACSCALCPACGVAAACRSGQNQRDTQVHTESLRGRCPPSPRGALTGTGIAYSAGGALWPVGAWSSRGSSGAGGTGRALGGGQPLNTEGTRTGHRPPWPGPGRTHHLTHVPRLALLSWRSRQTLRTGMVRSRGQHGAVQRARPHWLPRHAMAGAHEPRQGASSAEPDVRTSRDATSRN